MPPALGGHFGIARAIHLSVPWRSCLGYRHAGCLQLSYRRQPEMCGLQTRPWTDVDPPRFLDWTAISRGISSRRSNSLSDTICGNNADKSTLMGMSMTDWVLECCKCVNKIYQVTAVINLSRIKLDKLRLIHRLSTWRLLLSAGTCSTTSAARPQKSIDISCPQEGTQQQTCRPLPLLSINGTERRMPVCYTA